MFELIGILGLAWLIYRLVALLPFSNGSKPSLRGMLKGALMAIGLSWLFGGGDDPGA